VIRALTTRNACAFFFGFRSNTARAADWRFIGIRGEAIDASHVTYAQFQ
jgi:hypothetical protein